ncbi:hypothetical protein D3C87_2108760 [compost metagenome]
MQHLDADHHPWGRKSELNSPPQHIDEGTQQQRALPAQLADDLRGIQHGGEVCE